MSAAALGAAASIAEGAQATRVSASCWRAFRLFSGRDVFWRDLDSCGFGGRDPRRRTADQESASALPGTPDFVDPRHTDGTPDQFGSLWGPRRAMLFALRFHLGLAAFPATLSSRGWRLHGNRNLAESRTRGR